MSAKPTSEAKMNIYGLTLDIQTDNVTEIPLIGDKRTTEILGVKVPLVVTAVKLERKWRASVVEGREGSYYYVGTLEFIEDPDAFEEEEESPGEAIDRLIQGGK